VVPEEEEEKMLKKEVVISAEGASAMEGTYVYKCLCMFIPVYIYR